MVRQAGVLIPLFSIRTGAGWGVGEIPDLAPFARWAASAGFSLIQVLPVNEASRGQNSPYAALTAFGIDPVYAAVEALEDFDAAGGLDALTPDEQRLVAELRDSPTVRWDDARRLKQRALELAFSSFHAREWSRRTDRARNLARFAEANARWLEDYALFVSLHDDLFGGQPWLAWPKELRDREAGVLADHRGRLSLRVLFHAWTQWVLDRQWSDARRLCQATGVDLCGDLPFMVATDSADVWARRRDFRLDARVGVPPDAFSATGQDWGLPVYRWDLMRAEGHPWLRERARRMAELYGAYRVDHVVGLYRTYYFPDDGGPPAFVPAEEPAQIANGEAVLGILSQRARVIAEDLGTVPDFVRESLARVAVPGYRVLRWEKAWETGGDRFRDPADWPALSVATTGTHDTDTAADWFDALAPAERAQLLALPALAAVRARGAERFDEGVRDALLDLVYGAGSDTLLLPFQDLFGHRDRINVPGTVNDVNWTWRMPGRLVDLAADEAATARLRALAVAHGRAVSA
ncbi:MAG TPA: 4-alpha-glucanotransferase [Anaeromyxobacteraceae bacterium]|nr:4-alpha-glucanotransferase [Anaeromyxobacteraceae bacterium]